MSDRKTPVPNSTDGLSSLESTLARFDKRGPAPVHLWNPEFCGEIGLRIAADATWFYRDSPIGRKALVRLFSTILRKDDDGLHYLVTPVEKISIDVADAPFLAVEMEITGEDADQTLAFRTNVDDLVSVGPENPIRFERDGQNAGIKPYILVRGALEALVTRALTYDLIALAQSGANLSGDRFGVWSGGMFFPLCDAEEVKVPS